MQFLGLKVHYLWGDPVRDPSRDEEQLALCFWIFEHASHRLPKKGRTPFSPGDLVDLFHRSNAKKAVRSGSSGDLI